MYVLCMLVHIQCCDGHTSYFKKSYHSKEILSSNFHLIHREEGMNEITSVSLGGGKCLESLIQDSAC